MFFTANDSIKLNMSRDDAIKLFEKTFYDMHKAGYTLSTRIIHTDYNGKKFTGFIDDSGKYIARYIGNVENDRYYRSAPLSEVSFDGNDKSSTVNINVKSKFNAFYFCIKPFTIDCCSYSFNRYVQHHAKNSFYIHNRRCGCNKLCSFRNK